MSAAAFVTGTVTGGNCVGGIAGNGVGTIKNCYALADVTAAGDSAGGIAGYAYNLSIENCYYSGKVSSNGNAGGIAGIASGTTTIKQLRFSGRKRNRHRLCKPHCRASNR